MMNTVVRILALISCALAAHAQCTLENKLIVPPVSLSKFDYYGSSLDTYNEYLVVGAHSDDSLESDAGTAYVYKLINDKWNRIARLSPSDRQESLRFGEKVVIDNNTIAISGSRFDPEGNRFQAIYMFEKSPTGEWSSGMETYRIDVSSTANYLLSLDIKGDYLAVGFGETSERKVNLYKKQAGIFLFSQQIPTPSDINDTRSEDFATSLSLSDDLLAVCAPGFQNSADYNDGGAVFLYDRSGDVWTTSPIAKLQPSDRTQFHNIVFGMNVLVNENSIFVMARRYGGSAWTTSAYIFNEPSGGWIDTTEDNQVLTDDDDRMISAFMVEGDYIFAPTQNWKQVNIFKRAGPDWASTISKVTSVSLSVDENGRAYNSISVTANHMVVGILAAYNKKEGIDKVIDYQPNGQWEHGLMLNQTLSEASLNATDDFFGHDIAVSGDLMAVAAPGEQENGLDGGAVFLYQRINGDWVRTAKLTDPEGRTLGKFGHSVALMDSTLFISSLNADYIANTPPINRDVGMVQIFQLTESGWVYQSKLYAPVRTFGGRFGQEIACAGDYVAISEFNQSSSEHNGLVHLYKRDESDQWNLQATLRPSETIRHDFFGRSIAMNDSLIVIGTGTAEVDSRYRMKVYVYRKKGNEWQSAFEDAQLMPTVRLHNDYFGYSVALYGDEIVVGAPGNPNPNYLSQDYMKGTAYIFRKPNDGWTGIVHEVAQLFPSNSQRLGTFGYAVAIEKDDIFVGAPHNYFFYNVVDNFNNDDGHLKPGAVYHYMRKGDWATTSQEDRKVESLQPEWSDAFGACVKFHSRLLFVGSPLDDTDAGLKTGSVQVFMQTPVIRSIETPCVEDGLVKATAYPEGGFWIIEGLPEQASNQFRLDPGTYTLTYSLNGCSTSKPFSVMSSGLQISSTNGNQPTCINHDLYLESNADDSRYTWYFKENENGDYEVIETGKKRIVGNNPGSYFAEISHDHCEPYKEHFIVTPSVDISLEPQPVICLDDPVQLRGYPTGGVWSGPGISSESGLLEPGNLPNGTHTFQYSVVDESGCHFSEDQAVTIHRLIKPEIIASSHSLCFNDPVTLRVDNELNQASVIWHLLNEELQVGSGEEITVSQVGHYEAEVVKNGCVVRTEPFVLEPKQDSLFVPNIFIPNGDPWNEYFEITGDGLNDFDVQVFNRYGDLIYRSNDPGFKWNGANASPGTYYWSIQYSDCERRRKAFKGFVQLVKDN